jgi:hypothetical protein
MWARPRVVLVFFVVTSGGLSSISEGMAVESPCLSRARVARPWHPRGSVETFSVRYDRRARRYQIWRELEHEVNIAIPHGWQVSQPTSGEVMSRHGNKGAEEGVRATAPLMSEPAVAALHHVLRHCHRGPVQAASGPEAASEMAQREAGLLLCFSLAPLEATGTSASGSVRPAEAGQLTEVALHYDTELTALSRHGLAVRIKSWTDPDGKRLGQAAELKRLRGQWGPFVVREKYRVPLRDGPAQSHVTALLSGMLEHVGGPTGLDVPTANELLPFREVDARRWPLELRAVTAESAHGPPRSRVVGMALLDRYAVRDLRTARSAGPFLGLAIEVLPAEVAGLFSGQTERAEIWRLPREMARLFGGALDRQPKYLKGLEAPLSPTDRFE